jgi:nitrogen regulatory protein P-II 1
MKKIEAIVEQYEFEKLRERLAKAGFARIRASEVKEYGTTQGLMITYRGTTQTMKYLPKIKIELICTEPAAEIAMAIIAEQTKSSRIEDGDVFVSAFNEDIRLRREEFVEVAL